MRNRSPNLGASIPYKGVAQNLLERLKSIQGEGVHRRRLEDGTIITVGSIAGQDFFSAIPTSSGYDRIIPCYTGFGDGSKMLRFEDGSWIEEDSTSLGEFLWWSNQTYGNLKPLHILYEKAKTCYYFRWEQTTNRNTDILTVKSCGQDIPVWGNLNVDEILVGAGAQLVDDVWVLICITINDRLYPTNINTYTIKYRVDSTTGGLDLTDVIDPWTLTGSIDLTSWESGDSELVASAITSWFFNGDGTEAAALYRVDSLAYDGISTNYDPSVIKLSFDSNYVPSLSVEYKTFAINYINSTSSACDSPEYEGDPSPADNFTIIENTSKSQTTVIGFYWFGPDRTILKPINRIVSSATSASFEATAFPHRSFSYSENHDVSIISDAGEFSFSSQYSFDVVGSTESSLHYTGSGFNFHKLSPIWANVFTGNLLFADVEIRLNEREDDDVPLSTPPWTWGDGCPEPLSSYGISVTHPGTAKFIARDLLGNIKFGETYDVQQSLGGTIKPVTQTVTSDLTSDYLMFVFHYEDWTDMTWVGPHYLGWDAWEGSLLGTGQVITSLDVPRSVEPTIIFPNHEIFSSRFPNIESARDVMFSSYRKP